MPDNNNPSPTIPPAPGYGSSQFQNLWPTVYGIATTQQPPLDPNLFYSLIVSEGIPQGNGWAAGKPLSSGQQAQGPAQVLPSTAATLGIPGAANPASPNFVKDNLTAGAQVLNNALSNSNGDVAAALFAYKGAVTPDGAEKVADSVQGVMERAGYGTGTTPSILSPSELDSINIQRTASTYNPLTNNSQNIDLAALVPQIVIQEGLDAVPWYSDPGLLTGNPRLRKEVQPVSFQVMLHDNTDFLLSTGGETGVPIQVQLNASMKSINWSMKHVYNHQRTRTAQHITLWGMQADIIEGRCTTGIFMNQLGLTDYYSTRTINDNLKTLIGTMFSYNGNVSSATTPTGIVNNTPLGLNDSNNPINNTAFDDLTTVSYSGPTTKLPNGQLLQPGQSVTTATGSPNYTAVMNRAAQNNPNFSQTDAFRVAAQDAFMEFLALFKMNGSVWFWNKTYSDDLGNTRDWTGIQAWSPTLGLSGAQKQARNNDVLTRGGVLMSYRNFVYQGYFKTLQWEMNAGNPFKWDFSFTFQVEKTVGQKYILG